MSPIEPFSALRTLRAISSAHRHGIYLGAGANGAHYGGPEQCGLVLGPPRAGKTSAIVIPNVLSACGGVVAVSTKSDVMSATASSRSRLGRCMLFDPSGLTPLPDGVERVGWSPLLAAHSWDDAVLVAESMVGAASSGAHGDSSTHWSERAAALLAPLMHAGALDGSPLSRVVSEVNRRDASRALGTLARAGADIALDVLCGIDQTDSREQSGIWSTASGVLAAYRSEEAIAQDVLPPVAFDALLHETATLYVVASAERQHLAAPLVAGLVRDLRSVAYGAHARSSTRPPLLLVLDELAHIAPLHDLPALIAEGASQGVLTLACLQDLSQARRRWGVQADGFFSLFGIKVVLAGIGDTRTLEDVSVLAGDRDVVVTSRQLGLRALWSTRPQRHQVVRRQRRLSPSAIALPQLGTATLLEGARVTRISLTPYFAHEPWRSAARCAPRQAGRRQPIP